MWISRKDYTDLVEGRMEAQTVAVTLGRTTTYQTTTIDWLKMRLTQVEMERAQLIQRFLGVSIPVPEFAGPKEPEQSTNELFNFKDIGDAEADRLGIGWNADGTLRRA